MVERVGGRITRALSYLDLLKCFPERLEVFSFCFSTNSVNAVPIAEPTKHQKSVGFETDAGRFLITLVLRSGTDIVHSNRLSGTFHSNQNTAATHTRDSSLQT